jgi:hypothetical protein
MARWKEPIARLSNAEMETTGHFWEARFGCRELVDDAAVLTCNLYLDLNQLRAGMAESLEDSRHSAIRNRILAAKEREARRSLAAFAEASESDRHVFSEADAQELFADCWLAPLSDEGPLLTADALPSVPGDFAPTATGLLLPVGVEQEVSADEVAELQAADRPEGQAMPPESQPPGSQPPGARPDAVESHTTAGETPSAELLVQEEGAPQGKDSETVPSSAAQTAAVGQQAGGPRRRLWPRLQRPRASDAPLMAVPWEEYQRVLETLARTTLEGAAALGSTVVTGGGGESLAGVLERWGMQPEAWLAEFHQLESRCPRAMGTASHLRERAAQVGRRWLRGVGWCREIFLDRPRPSDAFT